MTSRGCRPSAASVSSNAGVTRGTNGSRLELTVQQNHGLISTSEWTGVPLSLLLDEVGARKKAQRMQTEGADGAAVDRGIPLTAFIRANTLIAHAQNGEPLRPANGFPLRLVLPGLEGNTNTKWLRRLKLGTARI